MMEKNSSITELVNRESETGDYDYFITMKKQEFIQIENQSSQI
jgi:hypothetical protein